MATINLDEIDQAAASLNVINGQDAIVTGTADDLPNEVTTTGAVVQAITDALAALSPPITPGSACPGLTKPTFLQQIDPYKCTAPGQWKFRLIYKGFQATQIDVGTTLQEVDSNTNYLGEPIVVEYNYPAAYRYLHPEIPPGVTKQGGTIPKKIQETTIGFKFTFNGGGAGSGAAATAMVNNAVTQIIIEDGGTGFTASTLPTLDMSFGGGSGAAVTLTADSFINEINVVNGGSGYSQRPKITFSGGGGAGAQAQAQVSGGVIVSIAITNGGSGYTSAPTIGITDSTGSGATATATADFAIGNATLTDAGSGYTPGIYPLAVTYGSGGIDGSGLQIWAYVSDGISSLSLSGGTGYINGCYAYITDSSGGTGTGAIAQLEIDDTGALTGINLLNPGYGFTDPVVTFIGGTGATSSQMVLAFAQAFVGMTNEFPWASAPGASRTWLCVSVRGISRDGGKTYEITATFAYRAGSWDFLSLFTDPYTGKPPQNILPTLGYDEVIGYMVGTLPTMPPSYAV
jgi:hypothetical protein